MLLLLIILLSILLLIAYLRGNKEICAPSILFIAPFDVMCIVAFFLQEEWSFTMGFNTFMVVLVGNICFFMGTVLGGNIRLKQSNRTCSISDESQVSVWKLLALIVFQCVCYLMKLRYIMNYTSSHGVAHNLSASLGYYNNISKFTTEETVNYPLWLAIGLNACTMIGFICACMLAQQFVSERRNQQRTMLLMINFIIALAGGLTSGGRGGTIQVIVSFVVAYFILYERKYNWEKSIPLKSIIRVGIVIVVIAVLFVLSATLIGRGEIKDYWRYISNYIGAQIYNLDYFLNSAFERSQIWGQETFYPIIEKISSWLNISTWSNYHVGYSSVYAAGYSTGNVYTIFYTYIKDFGYIGSMILTFILGVFCQIVYRYARKSPMKNPINISMVFYSNLAYMIAFSYFADKFGSIVFTLNMAEKVALLIILEFLIYRIDIKGTKIIIKTDNLPVLRVTS